MVRHYRASLGRSRNPDGDPCFHIESEDKVTPIHYVAFGFLAGFITCALCVLASIKRSNYNGNGRQL